MAVPSGPAGQAYQQALNQAATNLKNPAQVLEKALEDAATAFAAATTPTKQLQSALDSAAKAYAAFQSRVAEEQQAAADAVAKSLAATTRAIADLQPQTFGDLQRAVDAAQAALLNAATPTKELADELGRAQIALEKFKKKELEDIEKAEKEKAKKEEAARKEQEEAEEEAYAKRVEVVKSVAASVGDAFKTAVGGMAAGVVLLRSPMHVLDSAISSVSSNIGSLVGKLNPGYLVAYNRAVDDLQAAIGQALLPVLNAATQVFRSIGSAIYGSTSAGKLAVAALAAGAVGLGVFAVVLSGTGVAATVATVGVLAFSAAMAAVEAVATGGIGPILSAIGYALGAVGTAGGGVAAVFAGLAASLAGVWAITADLKPALDAAAKVLSGLMNSLGRTIQALMPAIQPVIDFVGRLAGELAGLIDMGLQVVEALAPVIQVVTSVAVQILEALKPAIAGGLVVAIAGLAASLAALVVPMLPLIGVVAAAGVVFTALAVAVGKAIKVVIGWIEQLFGIDLSLKAPEGGVRDDTGLAARQTSTTSTEALLQKAREQAFMVGGNAPQKPEVARLDTLNNKLDALTSNLKTWIVDAAPAAIGKAVGAFVTGGAGDFAKGVAGGGGTTPAAVAGGLVSGLAPGAGLVAGLVDGARRLMP